MTSTQLDFLRYDAFYLLCAMHIRRKKEKIVAGVAEDKLIRT